MAPKITEKCFPSASEDAKSSEVCVVSPQTKSDAYKLAFQDSDFLLRDESRPIRLQLELMKPELILQEHGVDATIVMFGGSRIPDRVQAIKNLEEAEMAVKREPLNPAAEKHVAIARRVLEKANYYEEAKNLARLISENCENDNGCSFMVATGGGPGIMEAANRGAHESGAKSIGLNIVLPHEQAPNPYITPELCFQFHYFALRKMHFLMRAKALVAFPGGYGTMDELFETLTMIQTKKIKPLPVLLFGKDFWTKAVNFEFLLDEGVIGTEDLDIFMFVETAGEAWEKISDFYNSNHNSDDTNSDQKSV